jgi:hypothetical protein
MSHLAGHTKLAELTCDEFKELVDDVVRVALTRVAPVTDASEFLNSRACATLLGVTPEHLCAMRARGEGPPWSGSGKWVRYSRQQAVAWLTALPALDVGADQPTTTRPAEPHSDVATNTVTHNSQRKQSYHENACRTRGSASPPTDN